ncbi:MAG: metal ABC transporter substrate-binding protein [Anaerolineae bacterium]
MKRITCWLLLTLATLSVLLFAVSGCRSTTAVTLEHTEQEREQCVDEMEPLSPVALSDGAKLQVIATTSIVADVVRNIGGDLIDLTMLMPLGTDPHTFDPTPRDVAAVADSHVVFVNGAGLEEFLEPLLESAGEDVIVVSVSCGVELVQFKDEHEEGDGRHQGGVDPHTWFDPNNVMVWTRNVEHALSALDPDNAGAYEANAKTYQAELEALDAWIHEQFAQVPEANRRLVTDHTWLSYLAHRYGFTQVGAVFPGYSTLAEPSAQELAALEDAIREFGVQAIFVSMAVNPGLAQRVADDTGTRLISLYTASLSEPGGPADDYLSLMRYNVAAIAGALH